ncbi:alkanesulfonate monooxygenase [Grosmannia clavigera kw1407]|uniref:Alkanesulfonate monooxygenase n=1 Tax=Grosmannia clavigera (strain kw1407 / UAMH 11150) TaxID=655863 RepID=F0XEL7_GROCL|nr:alkanesulfonate monooxygenase [Grosmannia clavigera kw1407]EFX04356.1 alkanesulfonate monooxygenase [Grosmannia clavigera kw1407]
MPVEFNSAANATRSSELHPISGAELDPEYLIRYARTLDEYGYKYTLVPYNSSGFDNFAIGATILNVTKQISVILALRPNTTYPTVAARKLATLDRLSGGGRVVVHLIAGGSDAEQAREGDFLSKAERYAREEEYIRILKRAWSSSEPFDWAGKYYTFKEFRAGVRPVAGRIPISVGGPSEEAYRVGGALADIFGLWGEPLKETREQIDKINAAAAAAGRTDRPRIWVTFRPIVAETEELAWAKAHRILAQLQQIADATLAAEKTLQQLRASGDLTGAEAAVAVAGIHGGRLFPAAGSGTDEADTKFATPENIGSQRLLEIASRGEVQGRALWYPTVTATNARGASTALVGSYQTVVDSILDYVDIGADLISIRGYDNYNDAVNYGRHILPGVYKALEEREATKKTSTKVLPESDKISIALATPVVQATA